MTPEKIIDSSTSDITIWKLVIPAARAASARLWRELREVRPVTAADRVEMQRQAARRDGAPHRLPPRVPQPSHVVPSRDFDAAHATTTRHPLDLADRGVDVVVRDAGEPGKAVGMGIAELGEPVVVDAQHLARGLVIVDPNRGAEDTVQHLGLNPVSVLVLDPQLGIGHAADALFAVVVDSFRRHPVRAMDLAGLIEPAARAHAVHQPERGAILGHPLLAARPVGHVGHAVLHRGRTLAVNRSGGSQIKSM